MNFALAGNQNCGKTTLFNQLTGANQHVGNFPGVTVDQKSGVIKGHEDCTIVDLPGIYSLRPFTNEEIITRDFIINGKPDGIINIVDATNIERNLYLTLQLLVMRIPMVVALNMMDEVVLNGGSVDSEKMSDMLGVPVIPISAVKNQGTEELVEQAIKVAHDGILPAKLDFCGPGPVHRCIHAVSHVIEDHAARCHISPRFAATKLVEGDAQIEKLLAISENEHDLIEHSVLEMETDSQMDRNEAIASMRYDFIETVVKEAVKKPAESIQRRKSVRIDKVLTSKYWGIPVFLGIMLLVFYLTFDLVGQNLSDLLAQAIDWFTGVVDGWLTAYQLNPVVQSLVIDGIFAGIGSVLSFLPVILVLFLCLSILEDSGYMARIAFVMDRLLRKIGLSGRSIVPMLLGFGCSVPAIMATRTLSSERDRKMTMLLVPFVSCSAKIPIYAVFTAAFFQRYRALVMIGLYVMGILIGIVVALIGKKTLFKGNSMPFVMELPNYRLPSVKSVVILMWEKAKDFIERAFSVILVATVIIWFLQTFDTRLNVVMDNSTSLLAALGRVFSPIFKLLGFTDWRITTALITGFTAKEAVVSTLGVLLDTSTAGLTVALSALFTPASALSFLTFTLLYSPCVAAIAAIRRELGNLHQTLLMILFQCTVAWVIALLVYRAALLFFV